MKVRKRFSIGPVTILVGVMGFCFALPPPASLAYSSYKPAAATVFGEPGTGNAQFQSPAGIAVNDTTGRVYVADKANNRVEYFSATGAYEGQFNGEPGHPLSEPQSVAVNNSCYLQNLTPTECQTNDPANGEVYVTNNGHSTLDIYTANGQYTTQLTGTPTGPSNSNEPFAALGGTATDAQGDILTYTFNENENTVRIAQFTPTGTYQQGYAIVKSVTPGLAVDTNDTTYTLSEIGKLSKVTLQGEPLEPGETEGVIGTGLAVRLRGDHLFVNKGGNVVEFGAFGEPFSTPLVTFATVGLEGSRGIAVNDADGTVYVSEEQADKVEIFPEVVIPAPGVTTGGALAEAQTTATVTGSINTEELNTSYYYEYGSTTGYGRSTTPTAVSGGSAPVPAQGGFENLVPDTTYHYRLVAISAAGTGFGADQQFTTSPYLPPVVATGAASGVSASAATISGVVNPEGIQTTYEFQLGTDTSYGAQVFANAGYSSDPQPEVLSVAGLQPATTYHYRLCATNEANAGSPACGADATFTTAAVPGGPAQPATPPLLSTPAIAFPKQAAAATSVKALTNAHKLKNALRACGKDKSKTKRARCEKAAKKRYGTKTKAKPKR